MVASSATIDLGIGNPFAELIFLSSKIFCALIQSTLKPSIMPQKPLSGKTPEKVPTSQTEVRHDGVSEDGSRCAEQE